MTKLKTINMEMENLLLVKQVIFRKLYGSHQNKLDSDMQEESLLAIIILPAI